MSIETNKKLFQYDIGVNFRVYAGTDISEADTITMKIYKPNGSTVSWIASLDATNNKYAAYTTQSVNDLDQIGTYLLSLVVTWDNDESLTGATDTFSVYEQFKDC